MTDRTLLEMTVEVLSTKDEREKTALSSQYAAGHVPPVCHALVRRYFRGALKPPFIDEKRAEAGLSADLRRPRANPLADGAAI